MMQTDRELNRELPPTPIPEPIAVTGATGFIGRRLVARLLAQGYEVRAIGRAGDPVPIEWGQSRVEIRRADVTRQGDVVTALSGTRYVFHLAALVSDWGTAAEHRRVTVTGTENVLAEAVARSQPALLVSSIAAYGDRLSREVCDEGAALGRAVGPYGAAKQAQEQVARRLEQERGLKVTIVRPANVYGAASGPWVDTLCQAMDAGKPVLIGGGNFVAALTHVDNVVDVLVRAAERRGAIGRVYDANDDHGAPWQSYVGELARLGGMPAPRSVTRALAATAARILEPSYCQTAGFDRNSAKLDRANRSRVAGSRSGTSPGDALDSRGTRRAGSSASAGYRADR